MLNIPPTAISILTLLNNSNDLIIQSNDRQNARDVMKALNIYAHNKNFKLPEDKIDNFNAVILDARSYTLSSLIQDIAKDIINRK